MTEHDETPGNPIGRPDETGPPEPPSTQNLPPTPPLPPPPEGLPSHCTQCGKSLAPEHSFCGACGAKVDSPAAPAPASKKPLLILAGLAIAAIIAGAIGFFVFNTESTETVEGTLQLKDDRFEFRSIGDSCEGSGGYSDIRFGSTVRLADGDGNTIATGSLGPGLIGPSPGTCFFIFDLSDVPQRDFYSLSIGGGRRGELTYSRAELEDRDWSIDLTIGN